MVWCTRGVKDDLRYMKLKLRGAVSTKRSHTGSPAPPASSVRLVPVNHRPAPVVEGCACAPSGPSISMCATVATVGGQCPIRHGRGTVRAWSGHVRGTFGAWSGHGRGMVEARPYPAKTHGTVVPIPTTIPTYEPAHRSGSRVLAGEAPGHQSLGTTRVGLTKASTTPTYPQKYCVPYT